MKHKLAFALALAAALPLSTTAQEAPRWLRWCAISPDGKQIAFLNLAGINRSFLEFNVFLTVFQNL